LFNWFIKAQHKSDDPFFSYRQCWKLTYDIFNNPHKTIARSIGINHTNFSTHSSRIGGACTLAAAGFPDSYIMLAGCWSSLSFLFYIRLAMQKYQEGLNALSNPLIFTINDVKRLVPTFDNKINRSLRN